MGETKKETKKSAFSNAGQAISRRILVAEDNKTLQDVVSRILDFMGFEVALAGNGVEALSLFIENSFDLVRPAAILGLSNCLAGLDSQWSFQWLRFGLKGGKLCIFR